jgi:hypothetical protein
MSFLVIRIHPVEPVSGDDFKDYLDGLTITAFDISFNNPEDGVQIGNPAQYISPTDQDNPPDQDNPLIPNPNTQIVQHHVGLKLKAVATAVIEIPDPPDGEEHYLNPDVRLDITRNGNEIAHNQNYYNVPVAPVSIFPNPQDPNEFQELQPTSLYLALPPSEQSSPTEILPEDGTAPTFRDLLKAVDDVVKTEEDGTEEERKEKIANLTLDQCRHIAYEIIWNRNAYPLPEPKQNLEQIYTGPQDADDDEERDRRRFEGELQTYYTTHDSEADRLTDFVFSLSAAFWCEKKSKEATKVGFYFPVLPESPERQAKVILKGVADEALNPAFEVPAAYFYALTATSPPQIRPERRFKMATLETEAHNLDNIEQAHDDQILDDQTLTELEINPYQAARRLRALGSAEEIGTAECEVNPVHGLIMAWLSSTRKNINEFWRELPSENTTGHLDLVLCAITKAHDGLVNAIKNKLKISNANELNNKTNSDWEKLFENNSDEDNSDEDNLDLLPEFTKPGTKEERIQAFIRHLRNFFDVANDKYDSPSPPADAVPSLDRSANPLDALLNNYDAFSFSSWDSAQLEETLSSIFPGDPEAQQQFTEWLSCIQQVINLTDGIDASKEMQFSVIEALWARGFIDRDVIAHFASKEEFKEALVGSVAYDYVDTIWKNADVSTSQSSSTQTGFRAVNSDSSLVNCIPPAHLSPLGPVAYLHELLKVSGASTCDNPLPIEAGQTVGAFLESRRGLLGSLLTTKANLDVPIPLIDIVNESLEYMVANDSSSGTIYNTASDQVGGHELTSNAFPSTDAYLHDPETLLQVLPEHSTPAIPTPQQVAYNKLQNDFSACNLPYSQPLDVSRAYLKQLRTSRFATMRHFRKDITEFVLDPANEPEEFQTHLWRYPVRIETALEYLGITPEEYEVLFQNNIASGEELAEGQIALHAIYGFISEQAEYERSWIDTVIHVSDFLERTCLTYCEFLELWKSEFVKFGLKNNREEGFPDCEPCCLDQYVIEFENPEDPAEALKQLAIFIRLWRKLQAVPNARYTFTELRDICDVLGLFDGANINPDFIRQLVAFQMFRDDFQLSLTDGTPTAPGATGADRLHLLAFWVPEAAKRNWAVDHLLYQIQQYALNTYHCSCREPEFIKLLKENLDPISALAGFNPSNPTDTWHTQPTHTLRLAEILAKIYASEFRVGELRFLFTSKEHLQGDDPFPLQTANEAKDSPLSLPDDEDQFSLWALRQKLMAVEISAEAAQQWTWTRMETVLKDEFSFSPASDYNPWLSLGQHFFPTVLADSGIAVSPTQQQYRVSLGSTVELMWNTPPEGPFHYDPPEESEESGELWTQIPLTDEAVLAKLSRIRQLSSSEQRAVRDLYFLPRVDLAYFAFIFNNLGEAEEKLIQEPDESKRWAWFQQEFARFYQRCQIVAEHLAAHTADITSSPNPEGTDLAKLLLKNLWADENKATTPWEDDDGQSPYVTWQPQPHGRAFAALLGITGTGMLAEYFDTNQTLRWREVRGGADAFGPEENDWNAPIPTILPSMEFTFSPEQLRFAAVRNGFAMANTDGAILGGAEPFKLRWQGLLLIENEGQYGFSAGAPTAPGDMPDFEKVDQSHRWRVILKRGQRTWVLLAHDWPNEEAPAACSAPIALKKGFYELEIELERKPLSFDGPEDVCPQTTGFQLKYNGPDADMSWLAIPQNKLFQNLKKDTLQQSIELGGVESREAAQDFLEIHYTSTMRDIRRTYQRAFKAMLLVNRLRLSAQQISDDGQSELGYMLAHPDNFAGQAYYRGDDGFVTHRANFDLNFLPVLDNYDAPPVAQDRRVAPTLQRQQAMFDWWERLFDYTVMRRETQRSPEQPAWLLFHESAEMHPDEPADLVRHLGIDLRHSDLVLQYYSNVLVSSNELEDDRWAVRVWQSEKYIRALLKWFYPLDIREARPDLWASDNPSVPETAFGTTDESGNENLTQFYRNGCIENGEPRRYKEIKHLNDALRQRGWAALVAYLTHMNRVALPWGGFATEVKHLSELLLFDVEAGICQKTSRIEEAVSVVHLLVQRVRLGLEPEFKISPDFTLVWDRCFATFRIWEACKRRFTYQENWIEWDELQQAKQTEAFQFLESELRQAKLTMPVPGGLTDWKNSRPPTHSGITLLQHREPATMQSFDPAKNGSEGLGLMGTPNHHAHPTWLAPVHVESTTEIPQDSDEGEEGGQGSDNSEPVENSESTTATNMPMWLQAAAQSGKNLIRVAAAGIPPATTTLEPKCGVSESSVCCSVCGEVHPALMDEYYFWIEETQYYAATEQVAEWGATADNPQTDWHRSAKLPSLLHWKSKPMVHLRWCRVHNGEFQEPRQSYEGVKINSSKGGNPQLVFSGRSGDSLYFEVTGGESPTGIPAPQPDSSQSDSAPEPPGFRYDLASDEAIVVPQVKTSRPQDTVGGLAAFPFFGWFDPGKPLLPPSMFSTSIAVAGHLRSHCQFEAALKWYESTYNPLLNDNSWIVSPSQQQGREIEITDESVSTNPTEKCCASKPVSEAQAKRRAILMHYLDTLLQWGDALMRRNTPEAFQQARLIFNTAANILGATPVTVSTKDNAVEPSSVAEFEPDCAPINPRLLRLYTSVGDRLTSIHTCLNAEQYNNGRPNLDMPYWGSRELQDYRKLTNDVCAEESEWCLPQSPYRFMALVQKAQEMANEVRALGRDLLATYEKGDAEHLSAMRAMHERQLLNLTLEVRQNQWREADWQVQALRKTKQVTQTRLRYYKDLINSGLIAEEARYEPLTNSSTSLRSAGSALQAISQTMNLIPDPHPGVPCSSVQLPPGSKLSSIASAAATVTNIKANIDSTEASLNLTKGGWERREQEWKHQVDVLTIEVEHIERQILAAERRRDVALHELNNHQQQIENAAEVHDFLRDKFTNHALYLWMRQETAAIHYQMYELALHCALQAQRAFNFERGHTTRQFIPAEIWDNLHEGLLSGERLQLAIQHMEKAYYDENVREYELTKHISLRLHFPIAFLQLKTTGYCEIDIPEWLFDLDFPGHYMRRLKNVSITIPCVVGPYTGVHCRLTLLSSKTRIDPRLIDPPHTCCHDEQWKNGYQEVADDPRTISIYGATEAIATSSGQNDSGMFELNFRDERYLPFEFSGAVSRWRIELPLENNHFDMETLSDVILHLNFMAREGGENLRKAANECAQQNLPGEGIKFFDVKRDFPEAWHWFIGAKSNHPSFNQLGIRLGRNMFPHLTGNQKIGIQWLEIFFEAPGADPSEHYIVEFLVGQHAGQIKEKCDGGVYSITCVANASWPGLFHGVLEVDFDAVNPSGYQSLGVFKFPGVVGEVTDAYLFCGYEILSRLTQEH